LEFVHRGAADDRGLVVSVFVQAGQKNAAFEAVLRALPKQPGGSSSPSGVAFDPAAWLPAEHAYIDYMGSMTTPPCTEGVRWCVLRSAIEASQDQIDRYLRDPRLAGSARPEMPANARLVRMGATP
ncbi:MAG: carbonic anhydrase family protein, partial [Candidatus Eiseniibacteriota bacterium]